MKFLHQCGYVFASAACLASPTLAQDSDGDGYPDASDNCPSISNPKQTDCDSDGTGDACELVIERSTGNMGAFGSGVSALGTLALVTPSLSPVTITVEAIADLNLVTEYANLTVGPTQQFNFLFQLGGADCPAKPDVEVVTVTAAMWNSIVAASPSGVVTIAITGSPLVSAIQCATPLARVTVRYGGVVDCNANGIPDSCDIVSGASLDCNNNTIPDSCDFASGAGLDCNLNGLPDSCDIASGNSNDVEPDGIPDECKADCNGNGLPDPWEILIGLARDCNANTIPDSCDIVSGAAQDCDNNTIPDSCDIASGSHEDCNNNTIPDSCDISVGTSRDCNRNTIPDSCDFSTGFELDCNHNTIPDSCDIASGTSHDCNANAVPDSCDIASGTSNDVEPNGVPDECNTDCNGNGLPDAYEVISGLVQDCNGSGIPDLCELANGESDDDADMILDSCEYTYGDFDLDGIVSASDLAFLISLWGSANPDVGDIDNDGSIGASDLAVLLSHWGIAPSPSPAISVISPSIGVSLGGTSVTISGAYFSGATSVTVGAASATNVVVVSASTITAITPAGMIGPVGVTVTTAVGSGSAPGAFTFTSPTPWGTILEYSPSGVSDATLSAAIIATGLPWRVRDNASNIEMLLVPPGTFLMGCSLANGTGGCSQNELPNHLVTLSEPFYLGRYEVTQAVWLAEMGSDPSYFSGNPNHPVEQVSWDMIQQFCTQNELRLPTEAEWEYAYRAGTTTAYHNGSGYPSALDGISWYHTNSGNQTHAVGGKFENALGMKDMSGNVSEWVNDWYASTYYGSSPSLNPTGPTTGTSRVNRGGGCTSGYWYCRSSKRQGSSPSTIAFVLGFRVAKTP